MIAQDGSVSLLSFVINPLCLENALKTAIHPTDLPASKMKFCNLPAPAGHKISHN